MSRRFYPRLRTLGSVSAASVKNWLSPTSSTRIKSIQRGLTSGLAASTITAVSMADSVLRYIGHQNNNDVQRMDFVLLTFTNPTTITPSANTIGGIVGVGFEVVEYWPGVIKSIQRGTIGASTTATITAVDLTKAELHYLGNTTPDNSSADFAHSYMQLTNATTITSGGAGGAAITMGWQVVEWY